MHFSYLLVIVSEKPGKIADLAHYSLLFQKKISSGFLVLLNLPLKSLWFFSKITCFVRILHVFSQPSTVSWTLWTFDFTSYLIVKNRQEWINIFFHLYDLTIFMFYLCFPFSPAGAWFSHWLPHPGLSSLSCTLCFRSSFSSVVYFQNPLGLTVISPYQ